MRPRIFAPASIVGLLSIALCTGAATPKNPNDVGKTAPRKAEGVISEGVVYPDRSLDTPVPELTPEQREDLLKGTERLVPNSKGPSNGAPQPAEGRP